MSKPDSDVETEARARLAADEGRWVAGPRSGSRRTAVGLPQAAAAFWRHPSPWLIGGFLVASGVYRLTVPSFAWAELIVPAALVLLLPLIEWVVHVVVLHWRPRRVAGVPVDPLLARKHRAHHADPRELPLVFIPWQVELWLLPAYAAVGFLCFPTPGSTGTFLVTVGVLMLGYEWMHYLVHSDYRPRTRAYRAVWRNHRLHHYKNEHYWFAVTTAGTADRLLGTHPDPATVATSPTVRRLHDLEQRRGDRPGGAGLS